MKNSETASQCNVKKERLACAISRVLTEERVPAERNGYRYLAYAIESAYMNREMAGAVFKELYPAVARAFSTSPQAVERAMRTAIARAREIRDDAEIRKRTNSEFIFQAVEQVKICLDKKEL